jgi:peptide-methionine (S)-S-oxide reductase
VFWDDTILRLTDLLELFFAIHDPTSHDRQGNDVGTQYRSVIFFDNEAQHEIITKRIHTKQHDYDQAIVTQIRPAEAFWLAE